MQIAICDDDKAQQGMTLQLLREYMQKRHIPYYAAVFDNGEELIKSAAERQYDIVILDIYMGDMDGVTAARELLKMQKTSIIFITASEDFAVEAFALHAVHYLVKPIGLQAFEDAMSRCFPLEDNAAIHELKTTQGIICIREDHICFIEATGKYSMVYTIDSETPYKCLYAFKQFVQEMKSSDFAKCHRSYLINLNYVEQITGRDIYMSGNHMLPISRTEKSAFMECYKGYLYRQALEG